MNKVSHARLVTAFKETSLNDNELRYLFKKYLKITNYPEEDEKKKELLDKLILQENASNEYELLKILNEKDIFSKIYPVYLKGSTESSLDLALNSVDAKHLISHWIANEKENYEILQIGHIIKNDYVFSNFMTSSYENWNENLIFKIKSFIKHKNTKIINNPYLLNTDAWTYPPPDGTHWMALYNTIESNVIHKLPLFAKRKEEKIFKYIENHKGLIGDLVINTHKLSSLNVNSFIKHSDKFFKYNEELTLFDFWIVLYPFFNSQTVKKSEWYGSIEYFDPLGDPIIKKSTNNISLTIEEKIISQCVLFRKMNALVLPIDWQIKQQNDSWACGYHSLAFLYNRIFNDSFPGTWEYLEKEKVKERINKLFEFNPKLEKCVDASLVHEEIDIEDKSVAELYGRGKNWYDIFFKMNPFKEYLLDVINERIQLPIVIKEQIEWMKIENNSIICEYSILKTPSSNKYFLTDYQQNHIIYCHNNEIYDSTSGIFVNGKKIYDKWQKSTYECILHLYIIYELRKNYSVEQIINILSDKNFNDISLKIYHHLFNKN